jgi:hypothetical protein
MRIDPFAWLLDQVPSTDLALRSFVAKKPMFVGYMDLFFHLEACF